MVVNTNNEFDVVLIFELIIVFFSTSSDELPPILLLFSIRVTINLLGSVITSV